MSHYSSTPTRWTDRQASRNYCRVFRLLPQGTLTLHSFRTATLRILIAEPEQIRESSITAGVNDTLPVIAKAGSAAVFQRAEVGPSCKAWSNGKPEGYAAERFPNVKALGRPGRCGLLRERSRLARLRPVDAIRRGALSGAHALWSSGSDSNGPPSCGVLDEAAPGHGLGSPLRCQRVYVKFMRQHAVRVAGPDRIIFVVPQRTTKGRHFIPVALLCVTPRSLW